MRTRLCVLALTALAIWGLKRHYSDAGADDLWWILTPTTRVVSAITGTTFLAVPSEGYVSHQRLFVIEKSCAGINFLIAALGMLVFALLHRVRSWLTGACVLGISLFASYVTAVFVNATRISIAMWLTGHPSTRSPFGAAQIHRVEGIVVYFAGLVLLYELARRIEHRPFRRVALPLAAYYAVTLALPIANGAAGAAFVKHAVVVLVLPPVLIALAWAVHRGTSTIARLTFKAT